MSSFKNFVVQVLGQVGVVERLKDAVCEKISLDLEGEAVNRSDISSLSCALKELGNDSYEYIFERPFLAHSLVYYKQVFKFFLLISILTLSKILFSKMFLQAKSEIFVKEMEEIDLTKVNALLLAEMKRIKQFCSCQTTMLKCLKLVHQEIVFEILSVCFFCHSY